MLVSPAPDLNSYLAVFLRHEESVLEAVLKAAQDSRTLVDVVPTVNILFALEALL